MNKTAWKLFKEKLPATLQLSGVFSIFLIIVYGLLYGFGMLINSSMMSLIMSFMGIIDFILMVFLVSFIVSILSPLIYSYFAANSILETKDEDKVTVGTFLKTYLLGTRDPIKGQLHIFSSLMWAFLTYLGSFMLLLTISFGIMSATNYLGVNDTFNEFTELFQAYQSNPSNEAAAEAVMNFIASSRFQEVVTYPLGYSNLIAALLAFYLFVHKVVINCLRYYPSTTLGGVPARPLNGVFKYGFRATRGKFYKAYYGTLYPLIIAFVLIFIGSYIGFSFIPGLANNVYVLNITSILVTSILMLPFLPVVFNLYNLLWPTLGETYMEVFIETAERQIQALKDNQMRYNQMEQDQLSQAEKSISKTREMFDKFKEDNKPTDSSNNNDNLDSNSSSNNDIKDEPKSNENDKTDKNS